MKNIDFKDLLKRAVMIFAICIAALLLLYLLSTALPGMAYPAVSVLVNDEKVVMDVLPVIEDGRTLVPVRAISEALNADVSWDAVNRKVTVKNSSDTIILYLNSVNASVSGVSKTLDVPARIIGGRTMIPLRFIMENFGATVQWDAATYTIYITTNLNVDPSDSITAQMEADLLTNLNAQRAKLNYQPVILIDAMTNLARGHAADMAQNSYFSHKSPTYGDTIKRCTSRGLPNCYEYIAYGYPFADKILESWLDGEFGSVLLAENTRFVGFGIYRGKLNSLDDVYAVCETFGGDGIIKGERQRNVSSAGITLTGWISNNSATLTIYQLKSAGSDSYINRQSYYLSPNGSDGAFSYNLQLWATGEYKICLGDDSILVSYY